MGRPDAKRSATTAPAGVIHFSDSKARRQQLNWVVWRQRAGRWWRLPIFCPLKPKSCFGSGTQFGSTTTNSAATSRTATFQDWYGLSCLEPMDISRRHGSAE